MTKPKFKVGDRVVCKNDPEVVSIVKKIDYDKMKYFMDTYIKGELFLKDDIWDGEDTEDQCTLDINHYIKNL